MTSGYSNKPLAAKLGITDRSRVLLAGSPNGFDAPVELPNASLRRRGPGPFDVVLLFCPNAAVLTRRFSAMVPLLIPAGALWACWPKRSSGVSTDLSESGVREHGLQQGVVDVKVAAINETWSGLKFVRRLSDR